MSSSVVHLGQPAPQGSVDAPIDASVRTLNRQRNKEATTKTRLLRVIGDPTAVSSAPLPGANRAALRQALADKKARDSTKRVRMERDMLENMLFKLFEKTPYWTLLQLQKQTEQPTAFLKEVLTDIAVVNKKGPNKVRMSARLAAVTPRTGQVGTEKGV